MTVARKGAIVVLGLRIAYGAGLVAAPGRLSRRWLGPAANAAPTQVPLRALGAREIVLHAGAILAAVRGAPLRPWLAGSIVGDLSDLTATVTGRDELPRGSATATLVVAGSSALLSAAVAATVES
ncbi:MAG TPA: hypothetical protein VHW04_22640 [Solirubrobacteraceae bacterium]|nr:hypothetical protein [Solirubrobacteraceae bacterium]